MRLSKIRAVAYSIRLQAFYCKSVAQNLILDNPLILPAINLKCF